MAIINLTRNGVTLSYTIDQAIDLIKELPLMDAVAALQGNDNQSILELILAYPKNSPYFQFVVYLLSEGFKFETNPDVRGQIEGLLADMPDLMLDLREIVYQDKESFEKFFTGAVLDKETWERLMAMEIFQRNIGELVEKTATVNVFGPNTSKDLIDLIIKSEITLPNTPEYFYLALMARGPEPAKEYIRNNLKDLKSDDPIPKAITDLVKEVLSSENSPAKKEILTCLLYEDPLFKKWLGIVKGKSNLTDDQALEHVLNYQHSSGQSPLSVVYEKRNSLYVKLFLALGANIDQVGKNGSSFVEETLRTPAQKKYKASTKNNLLVLIFQSNPTISSQTATELLRSISMKSDTTPNTVNELLQRGANLTEALDNTIQLGCIISHYPEDEWKGFLAKFSPPDLNKLISNADSLYMCLSRVEQEKAPVLFGLVKERLGDKTVEEILTSADNKTRSYLSELLPQQQSAASPGNTNNTI